MLDDVAQCGRQIKWKFTFFLLFLAVLSAGGAWQIQNGGLLSGLQEAWNDLFSSKQEFRTLECGEISGAFGNSLIGMDFPTVSVLDTAGKLRYSLEYGESVEPEIVSGKNFAVLYTPEGREVTILSMDGSTTVPLLGTLDAVFVGRQNMYAVTCSKSGFLTNTEIYSMDGSKLCEIGLLDAAMIQAVFLKQDTILAALCVDRNAAWSVRIFDLEGTMLQETQPFPFVPRAIAGTEKGFAVSFDSGVFFYNSEGIKVSDIPLSGQNISVRADEVYAVCCTGIQGTVLTTVNQNGAVLGKKLLRLRPYDLLVSGSRVYTLDSETLRVYDRMCRERDCTSDGALASGLFRLHGGCVMKAAQRYICVS